MQILLERTSNKSTQRLIRFFKSSLVLEGKACYSLTFPLLFVAETRVIALGLMYDLLNLRFESLFLKEGFFKRI